MTFKSQLAATAGPFTLLDIVIAPEGGVDTAIAAWRETTRFMRQRAGLLRADLYRGSAGSNVLINLAVWESAAALLEAVENPEFAEVTGGYPPGCTCTRQAIAPVAVAGICVS
ncbi:antibiotic biosynthesis monooxygenase family protein [Nocardia abscessus]|uniref:antibiotic biosynthesis monooxygenase family protein n=1 Tax=Nocardia abscessus TaxID=120957 RepID=UPI0024577F52|nr:antibiotic biosynthesis monooxygenase [Nocardia abscessus]